MLADLTQSRAAAAYAVLVEIERLAALLASASALTDRISLAEAIAQRHVYFRGVLDRLAAQDPQQPLATAAPALDDARRRIEPGDWWEGLAAIALFAPLTDELFAALTSGEADVSGAARTAVEADAADVASVDVELGDAVLADTASEAGGDSEVGDTAPDAAALWAVERLRPAIDADPVLAARMALWGRRLVGEAIVLARVFGGERYRELADRLAVRHARRLDELGLAG
ncbi:MAG TPA: ferritin-like fold-containing protein [Actinocrinis sp.]|uniref:ferritin-like fold-containing protein n=1 Tax=Actinocrinis sp. TaxID=1920516 RepID=UPI002DDD1113|nr:ferritin-like fold-containing protein [Actinocrinis sp.]HEV2342816.1 ferritin-like fold-containing protein [Actinocrinis sp.]